MILTDQPIASLSNIIYPSGIICGDRLPPFCIGMDVDELHWNHSLNTLVDPSGMEEPGHASAIGLSVIGPDGWW